MSRRFRWVDRAFGSNVLTLWSWLLTFPFAVTVMGGSEYVDTTPARGADFAVAAVVHVLTGVGMLVARYTVLRPGQRRFRRARALIVFAVLGGSRPFLLIVVSDAVGLHMQAGDVAVRVAINVVCTITMLTLIALLIDVLRRHRVVQRRLRAALTTLDLQREFDEQQLEGLRRQYVDDVTTRIDATLDSRRAEPLDATQASVLLRTIADEIVRPMSHELYREDGPAAAPAAAEDPVSFLERSSRILTALQPAPLVLPYVLLALVFLPHLLANVSLAFTAIQLVLGACIYLSGNAATMVLARVVHHPVARIGLLSLCYTATAIVGTLVMVWSAHLAGYSPSLNWSPAFIYPSFALALSIIAATATELAGDEQRLAGLLAEQVQHTAHIHNRLRLARKQTAHLLHTAVQGELVAAALTLQRRSADAGDNALSTNAWGEVMTTIARIKQEVAQGEVVDLTPASDRLKALVTMWGSALRITSRYDDEIWPVLAADAARTEMAVDALSEGFTNAVRHGNGQRVDVHLGVVGPRETVVITVRSSGVISSGPTNGLGLRSLRGATNAVTLSEVRGEVSLVVELV
ncbi:hypothetical protein GCM10022381_34170 [Leifsonia kafniensis]|uniref:Signal transduction histidine kinase subgroup 3 dimerisation and phosphoacceptor domain-containing protein n=1 Tax=Leifsonia kafniensis TaxID=475957 RepID=A0ABP7KWZ8_9MICO